MVFTEGFSAEADTARGPALGRDAGRGTTGPGVEVPGALLPETPRAPLITKRNTWLRRGPGGAQDTGPLIVSYAPKDPDPARSDGMGAKAGAQRRLDPGF